MSHVLILLASPTHPAVPALPGVLADGASWSSVFTLAGLKPDQVRFGLAQEGTLEAVAQWARALAAPGKERGLLILSGHGGTAGALLCSDQGDLHPSALRAILDRHLPGRGVTVIVDACPADGPVVLRDCDLVLSASAPGVPAEEIQVDGRSHGALSWACQRVLERWVRTGPHGGVVPISAAALARQAGMVLAGLGFAQVPTLTGPTDAAEAPLLGPTTASGSLRVAPLPAMVTRQIDPGHEGFRVYDLTAGGNTTAMVVIGPNYQPPVGWTANREYWQSLPVDGAVLKEKGGSPPGAAPSNAYTHFAFNPGGPTGSFTLTPSGSLQVFSLKSAGNVVGYLTVGTGSPPALNWYMTMSPLQAFFPVNAGGLLFSKVTSAVTITAQKRP